MAKLTMNRALKVLKAECEFLGMTFEELCIFIERNPYAVKCSTVDAYKIYLKDSAFWPPHLLEEVRLP